MLSHYATKGKNSFGAVRLAAAIAVVVTHSFDVVYGWGVAEPLHNLTGMSLGAHAVHVFFAISGFMVAASWERCSSWLDFVLARILRIMPALIFVNVSIALIGGIFLTTVAPEQYWTFSNVGVFLARAILTFSVGATVDGVFTNNPVPDLVNIPIWTIRFEVICYAMLAVFMAGVAALRLRGLTRLVPVLLVLVVSAVMVMRGGDPDYFSFVSQLARFTFAFYLGVAFWIARDRIPVKAALLASLLALTIYAIYADLAVRIPLMIATTAYGTFWAGSFPMGWLQRTTDRFDLSYGVYISGFFIQQLLFEMLPGSSIMTNAILSTAIALAVAWFSWTYIEQPALSLRKRLALPMRAMPVARAFGP